MCSLGHFYDEKALKIGLSITALLRICIKCVFAQNFAGTLVIVTLLHVLTFNNVQRKIVLFEFTEKFKIEVYILNF